MTTTHTPWPRVVMVATIGAILVAGAGRLVESVRYGATADETFARVETHVRERFQTLADQLQRSTVTLARHPGVPGGLVGDRTAVAALFELARAAVADAAPDLSVTVYDAAATPRAWTGRPSELERSRVLGDAAFFAATGPRGIRLVYLEPIVAAAGSDTAADRPRRLGAVSTESVLSVASAFAAAAGPSPIDSPLAPVALRLPGAEADGGGGRVFVLTAPGGTELFEAVVSDDDLADGRARWRRAVRDAGLLIVALILVLAALPELARAPRRGDARAVALATGAAALGLLVASACLWIAGTPVAGRHALFSADVYASLRLPRLLRSPADLLLLGLVATVGAATVARLVEVARVAWRHRARRATLPTALAAHAAAGLVAALLLAGYERLVADTIGGTLVDVLYPSLNPWDASRIGLLLGLLLAAAAVLWLSALALVAAETRWRHASLGPLRRTSVWIGPGLAVVAWSGVPAAPYLTLLAGTTAGAVVSPGLRPWFRHASHSARLATICAFLIVPALLAYPSLQHQGLVAKRRFVEREVAPAVARQPEVLLASLTRAQAEIDRLLAEAVPPPPAVETTAPTPDAAFSIWRQTELGRLRLTSAVELYGPDRELASRFALNFPEYAAAAQSFERTSCTWDVYGEVSPFGSQERRILHAERGVCAADGASAGTVVVHLPLDYGALPFIPSRSPYYDALGPETAVSDAARLGADVDLTIYGWGLSPLFSSGDGAWALDRTLFDRIYASRDPFWTTLGAGTRTAEVHISNDRAGVYAVGFPMLTTFDHFVRLAEIVALVGAAFFGWVLVLTVAGPFATGHFGFGRDLVRELRTSFYRRLFLAFVGVAVVPVLVLAGIIRNYSTGQLLSDAEAGAARTAVIAQRVIAELRQAADAPASVITDDLLVFVSQIIDQDVNIFEGAQLVATSERDLFASGLLPTRTPDAVFTAIVLAQAPSVVTADAVGPREYLLAAAPIPAAGDDAILTVPLASRQREIERQIADLDRGILLGVTLLILLGAASGYYIAERIADPVSRLTRATQRIARGDLDARVLTRSADELERLVAAFNRMAEELKAQRVRLERTHRLEAWAEMARQVAHEIKNPLTPVQLSAEHLLRVHRDHGEPLGPVLRSCVDSILKQVRILRQISSEFSSYASSPPVARRPTALADVVGDVLDSYRVGLDRRITLVVDVPPTLPPLRLDRTLVGRALTNVVENALHAMPGDGRLTVTAAVEGASVVLTIRDTGVGLDPATRARIFEPYFSTKVSGTGLGMAIAKRNVELNDGTIAVESEKGRGTTVILRFPLDIEAGGPGVPAPDATTPTG